MNKEILQKAATEARGLAIDAVHATGSGHLGLPLGCAEIGAVLWGQAMSYNPDEPRWINRDRFILSAGHGSMFLYTWLCMSGYDMSIEDLKAFRTLHSKTPGHPENFLAPGVECTTGPLGQGVGNAVGIAVSQQLAAGKFNTKEHKIVDSHTVVLAGDGCIQEGISSEASAYAAHLGLDNLILIYDDNDVTLDAMAEETQSEDTAARYRAYGWDVDFLRDGHNMEAFLHAFEKAKADDNGKPKLLIVKTEVGRGIKEVEGTAKAHGEGGAEFADEARKNLGLPKEPYYISDEVKQFFAERKKELKVAYDAWTETYDAWRAANQELARELDDMAAGKRPSVDEVLAMIPEFEKGTKDATRGLVGKCLQPLGQKLKNLTSGSADLHGSTKNWIKDIGEFTRNDRTGRNFRYGIREHAMGALVNGLGYDGLFIGSGATFLTFSDYMRPSIRLAALSKLPVFFIFTHDSVGVGEDGPTHQPVETTSSLRLIPNLDVIRPADPEESAGATACAIARTDGPTALILSRQKLPDLDSIPAKDRREGVIKGGYIAKKESGELKAIIMGTGSELQHAMAAAEELGDGIRVVSLPCWERFQRQSQDYRDSVLPPTCRARVAIEAGVPGLWSMFVGIEGKIVGINRFGTSAPGDQVMKELGITKESVIDHVKALIG